MEKKLLDYFKDELGTPVSIDTPLIESGIVDSMGVQELVAFIESTCNIEFEADDLTIENFGTIADIKRVVLEKSESS